MIAIDFLLTETPITSFSYSSGAIGQNALIRCGVNSSVVDYTEFLFGKTIIYYRQNGEEIYPIGDSKYSVDFDEINSRFMLTIHNLTTADADYEFTCRVVTSYATLESRERTLTIKGIVSSICAYKRSQL